MINSFAPGLLQILRECGTPDVESGKQRLDCRALVARLLDQKASSYDAIRAAATGRSVTKAEYEEFILTQGATEVQEPRVLLDELLADTLKLAMEFQVVEIDTPLLVLAIVERGVGGLAEFLHWRGVSLSAFRREVLARSVTASASHDEPTSRKAQMTVLRHAWSILFEHGELGVASELRDVIDRLESRYQGLV